MNKLLTFLIVPLLFGCMKPQVATEKAKDDNTSGLLLADGAVIVSQNKKFVLRLSYLEPKKDEFQPSEENTEGIQILTPEMVPVADSEYRLEVSYDMPLMPEMDGPFYPDPKVLPPLNQGRTTAKYLIYHGGSLPKHKWVFTYKIFKGQNLEDTAVRSLWVKE